MLEFILLAMQSQLGTSTSDDRPSAKRTPDESDPIVVYEFDSFRLDAVNRLLTRSGQEIALPGRAFDVLLMLVDHPGALLTKEEMMATVWSGSFVEESNLTVAISTLRRALQEDPHTRRYIQTVARRGYRFIADVRHVQVTPRIARVFSIKMQEAEQTADFGELTGSALPAAAEPAPNALADTPRLRLWPVQALYVVLMLVLVGGSWAFLARRQPIRTLAVLPFTLNSATVGGINGATSREVDSLEMTDEVISRLEARLEVRPTSSVLRYSSAMQVDAVAAGREQGVERGSDWCCRRVGRADEAQIEADPSQRRADTMAGGIPCRRE